MSDRAQQLGTNDANSMRPPVSLGRHRLLFAIGHGGMSDVYLALVNSAAGVNKLLVAKQLRASLLDEPEALVMFMDEARLAARLHHPNVVQTFEVGQEGPIPYMTMEFLDGQPLHRVLRRIGVGQPESNDEPLTLGMRLRIVTEMLEGLHYAHELRDYDGTPLHVVHRDVSPQNLFCTYDGQIKLVDFGIAKVSDSVTHTEGRGLKGKLAYMSPQQAGGETLDRRADVFAAGVMLWEMLGGRRLWDGCNEATIARRLVEQDLPDLTLPGVPTRLLEICRRALAVAVEDRYPSAEAFRHELERWMHDEGLDASTRSIGKRVAAAFAQQRAQIRARIDQELLAMVGDASPTTTLGLWSEPYRGEHSDRTLGSGSDELRSADPDEVTADYGPALGDEPAPPPPPPDLRREASGVIDAGLRTAIAASPAHGRGLDRRLVLAFAASLAVTVPLAWWMVQRDASPSETPSGPTTDEQDSRRPVPPPTGQGCDAPNKPRVRLSGEIESDATLTCDRDYLLAFTTRVARGVTLTIEPGTTLYGDRETKGSLVVQPGGRLIAEGTPERPIVFTSELPEGERKPGDWGGVLLLGQAPINLRNASGEPMRGTVEGLADAARYGGDEVDDDSGVLRYVRIEYSGSELAPGNEINGLTLAGVGRKTVLDHVEVRATSDDCFEFFGGTVDGKYLICDTPGDDAFDFDHGYQGRLQFVVVRDRHDVGSDESSNAFEIDNEPNGTTASPRTRPVIWNASACGVGNSRSPSYAILARRAAQAEVHAALISGFDFALDRRDPQTELELISLALIAQPPAEPDERDDDAGFDELAWLAEPARAVVLEVPGFAGCAGPMPASLRPSAPVWPDPELAGPPDDGFFDPSARWLGAFAGPDDDWTAPWAVWTEP